MTLAGKKLRSAHVAILLTVLLAVLMGFAIVRLGFTEPLGLLLLPLGVLLLTPPFIAPILRRQPINLLEPIYIAISGYALFLFVRPAYILVFDDYDMIHWLQGDPNKIPLVLAFAILGLGGIYIGYYSSFGTAVADALPTVGQQVSPKRLRNWGLFLVVLGAILYSQSGKITTPGLAEAAVSRDPQEANPMGSAYFYLGVDLAGIGVLFTYYWAKLSPRWWRILIVLALAGTFFFVGTYFADRYRVLYLAIALLGSYYLLADRPFRFRIVLLLLPAALIYVATVAYAREGVLASRKLTFTSLSRLDLNSALERFFSSSGDLNIFDAFVRLVTVIPHTYPYLLPGTTLAELFVHFIPRALWENKPLTTEVWVNSYMIGEYGVLKAQGGGWAYSLPASFYIEGGAVAILVGTILFGIFCRTAWAYNIKHRTIGSKMLLAVTLPTVLFHQRDGFTANNTYWYLMYLLPAVVGLYYSTVGSRSGKKSAKT